MKRDDILDVVGRVIRREFGCNAPLEESSDILGDLQLDSLQRVTLAVELENHFQICFDPDDEAGLATLGDVVDLVQRRLREESGGTHASEG
jgi:acyl carrier protein